jgi:hypothetical protein
MRMIYDTDQKEGIELPIVRNIKVNPYVPPTMPPIPDPPTPIPILTLVANNVPTVTAGDTVSIPIVVKNISTYTANSINIVPDFGPEGYFSADDVNPVQTIESLNASKSTTIYLKLRVSPDAPEKSHQIKLSTKFYNVNGDYYDDSKSPAYVYVKVINKSVSSSLEITKVDIGASPLNVGKASKIKIKIKNTGSQTLRDIKVTLPGVKADGLTLYNDINRKNIASLDSGKEAEVSFNIMPYAKLETGNHSLSVKVDYKDQSGKDLTTDEQQFFVPVIGVAKKDESTTNPKTVPKIILSQYSSNPSIVKAGQNFSLSLSFLNTSKIKEVRNIKISLTVPDGGEKSSGSVFTPVNGSNTLFIDSISPKGTVKKSLEFFTIPDASPKTYTITANFEYEDSSGTEYKSTEVLGVPVNQNIKLETGELNMPAEGFMGQPIPVALDFYNMGKAPLQNLMLKVEGDFDIQNGQYFVGNFDIGSSDHFEAYISPKSTGAVSGAVVLSYDDASGEHYEIRKDFTVNVNENMPDPGFDDPNIPPEPEKKSLLKNKLFWIPVGIVIAGIIVFITRKKIKQRKDGMTLDE